MHKTIFSVSKKTGLPYWWIEEIAIEYLDCREYATRNEIWTFNFNLISEADLLKAVKTKKVIVSDPIIHNVNLSKPRFLRRIASDLPVSLTADKSDFIAEGPVSVINTRIRFNPLEVWDPKLGFSDYFQVYDDGRFWQWKIAELVPIPGKHYGKWISSEIDLTLINDMDVKLRKIRNNIIQSGEPGHAEFKQEVEDFYEELKNVRINVISQLWDIHVKKKPNANFFKVSDIEPPLLSHFEKYTVINGKIHTKIFAEAMFFWGCKDHSIKARKIEENVKDESDLIENLDKIYQQRAISVILGTACIEAFVNGFGYEFFPRGGGGKSWNKIVKNKTPLQDKIKLLFKLMQKNSLYDKNKHPYDSLGELTRIRNSLIHYKGKYELIINNKKTKTKIKNDLSQNFIIDLPKLPKNVIQELCSAKEIKNPPWLDKKPDWFL